MEQLKKSNIPASKKREIKQKLTKLRKKLILDEKKRREIVEKISELDFLTPGQLENLFNSNYYESVINDILEERRAEEKCVFLMCPRQNRNGQLKSKFKISKNRLFENDTRKEFCSEKCYNQWNCMHEKFEELFVAKLDGKIDRIKLVDFGNFDVNLEFELDELVLIDPIKLEDVSGDKNSDDENLNETASVVNELKSGSKSKAKTASKPPTSQLELELALEKLYKSWLEPLEITFKPAVNSNIGVTNDLSAQPTLPNNDKFEKTNIRRKTLTDQLLKIVRVTCTTLFKKTTAANLPVDYEHLVRRLVGHFRVNSANVMIVKREMKFFVGLVIGVLLHLFDLDINEICKSGTMVPEKFTETVAKTIASKTIEDNPYLDVKCLNNQQLSFLACLYKKLGKLLVEKYRVEEDERVLSEIKINNHTHRHKPDDTVEMDLAKFQELLLEDKNEINSDSSDDFDDDGGWDKQNSNFFFSS